MQHCLIGLDPHVWMNGTKQVMQWELLQSTAHCNWMLHKLPCNRKSFITNCHIFVTISPPCSCPSLLWHSDHFLWITVFLVQNVSVNFPFLNSGLDWLNLITACSGSKHHWLKRCHASHKNIFIGQPKFHFSYNLHISVTLHQQYKLLIWWLEGKLLSQQTECKLAKANIYEKFPSEFLK